MSKAPPQLKLPSPIKVLTKMLNKEVVARLKGRTLRRTDTRRTRGVKRRRGERRDRDKDGRRLANDLSAPLKSRFEGSGR